MEMLTILDSKGAVVLERDLAEEKGPLLVVDQSGRPELKAAAQPTDKILGALVRGEDGWTLASSDPTVPVICGPRSGGDQVLLPGVACSLASFVFRVAGDLAASGSVILWRLGKSAVAAENVLAGRNIVAENPLTGTVSVNPPVVGDILFEFYASGTEVAVVAPDAPRLEVPARTPFACGTFEGLVLEAAEAEAALRSSAPFAYPSRGIRVRLMGGLILALLVFLGSQFVNREAAEVEETVKALPGARQTDFRFTDNTSVSYLGDAYLFKLCVLRDLELVLGPTPSPVTSDLISRGELFQEDASACDYVRFLKQVLEIQNLIIATRWDELEPVLNAVDRRLFTLTAAESFFTDAREMSTFASHTVPDLVYKISELGSDVEADEITAIAKDLETFSDNMFMSAPSVKDYVDRMSRRYETLLEYMKARNTVLDGKGAVPGKAVQQIVGLRDAYVRLVSDYDEKAYQPLIDRARKTLAAYVERRVAAMGVLAHSPDVYCLTSLCDLAEEVGVSAESVRTWRAAAREADRAIDRRYRDLYQRYRLAAGTDVKAAAAILEEMLSVAVPSRYLTWAEAEKKRLAEDKK